MKIKTISLILIVLLIFTSICGCVTKENTSLVSEKVVVQSVEENNDAIEEKVFQGVEKLEFDYRTVISPVIYDRTLYMSVSEERVPREDADAPNLISYNIDTMETEYLYETVYDSAYIQQISCDGKWLVWADQEIWGTACDICVMNLESREIEKIDHFEPEATSFLIPKLQNECVYWIKEEGFNESENLIYGSVYEYDCLTKTKTKLASIDYIEFYNISIGVGGGKVIWSETIDNIGTLFLYDIDSGIINKYCTDFRYACCPRYSDGYIVFQGQNDFSQRFEVPNHNYWYNIETGEKTEVSAFDTYMLEISDNFAASSCGTIIYYYKKDGCNLTMLEPYTAVRGECKFSENDIFINAQEDNNKTVIYINHLKDFAVKRD